MLLDQAGARVRSATEDRQRLGEGVAREMQKVREMQRQSPVSTVTVEIHETHDGTPCDCIDKTLTLEIGQELELCHVCHDGRVDKVIAKVVSIKAAASPEHGSATAR